MLTDPKKAATAGLALAAAMLVLWSLSAGVDGRSLLSFLFRLAHVLEIGRAHV
jgi:hypothetical protein